MFRFFLCVCVTSVFLDTHSHFKPMCCGQVKQVHMCSVVCFTGMAPVWRMWWKSRQTWLITSNSTTAFWAGGSSRWPTSRSEPDTCKQREWLRTVCAYDGVWSVACEFVRAHLSWLASAAMAHWSEDFWWETNLGNLSNDALMFPWRQVWVDNGHN